MVYGRIDVKKTVLKDKIYKVQRSYKIRNYAKCRDQSIENFQIIYLF